MGDVHRVAKVASGLVECVELLLLIFGSERRRAGELAEHLDRVLGVTGFEHRLAVIGGVYRGSVEPSGSGPARTAPSTATDRPLQGFR